MLALPSFSRSKSDPKIIKGGPSSATAVDRLAKSLAWFGIGLGTLEIVASKPVARLLGVSGPGAETIIRAFGAREIAAGVVTLSTEKKAGLWLRVAGDGLDTVALLGALSASRGQRDNVKLALLTVLGATALDLFAASRVSARSARGTDHRSYSDRSGFPRGLERTRMDGRLESAQRKMSAR